MHAAHRIASVGFVLLVSCAACPATETGRLIVRPPREIEFTATVNARGFERSGMPGYHALVWKRGRMAHAALLQSDVADVEILDALESLGAKPAGNLPMDAWEERRNPQNPAADEKISGAPVEILLRLPSSFLTSRGARRRGTPRAARDDIENDDSDLVPLGDVLLDPARRGLDMRLAGNRENIPKWRSGCVVCLYSCPGSKIGNARYTVREWEQKVTRFRPRPAALPRDGTKIGVVLRLTHS